jgi:hypothetical protein
MTDENKPEEKPVMYGPLRKLGYYAGDGTIKGKPINKPDVQRNKAGKVIAKHDKLARRMIRGALARANSTIEVAIVHAHGIRNAARELAWSSHGAARLLKKELALHTPAPQPPVRGDRYRMPRHVRESVTKILDAAIEKAHDKEGE